MSPIAQVQFWDSVNDVACTNKTEWNKRAGGFNGTAFGVTRVHIGMGTRLEVSRLNPELSKRDKMGPMKIVSQF